MGRGWLIKATLGWLAAGTLLAGNTTAVRTATAPIPRPNIVLILADDLGFSDAGCYGGEIGTPNIDGLAREGVRFRQAYNCALCVSSRASLMSGLYPQQSRGRQGDGPLAANLPTVADLLRAAGYRTYLSGKWDFDAKNRPRTRGFDHAFGILEGASNYFKHATIRPTSVYLDDVEYQRPDDFYMTNAITDQAITFLERDAKSEKPFFLYLAYTAPHFPLHALPADIAKFRHKYLRGWDVVRTERARRQVELGLFDGSWRLSHRPELAQDLPWADVPNHDDWDLKMAVYAAQVAAMDRGIGRVLETLRRLNVEPNTLVLFLSDNGAAASNLFETGPGKMAAGIPAGPADSYVSYGLHWANASNTPFTLYKTWTHEGGIATPLIARWPAVVKRGGGFTDDVVHLMDVTATCLDAAGARYPAEFKGHKLAGLEGISFLPTLQGRTRAGHAELCWSLYGNKAIRRGDWKLVSGSQAHLVSSFKRWRYPPAKREETWELYNLATDRGETDNQAKHRPELMRELARAYDAWAARVGVRADAGDGVN